MPASTAIAGDVASRGRGLAYYVQRVERVHRAGHLARSDVLRAYAGAFLGFYAYTERSLERLFLGTVMRRVSYSSPLVAPLVTVKSDVVLRALLAGGRNYVDWLPYETHTLKRAPAYLSGGRPFADLPKADRAALERIVIIRNALAHESNHSLRVFRRRFVEGKSLPSGQQTPAGYLRGQHAAGQSRFAFLVADAVSAFNTLCT